LPSYGLDSAREMSGTIIRRDDDAHARRH
jgi:hypothetical protein